MKGILQVSAIVWALLGASFGVLVLGPLPVNASPSHPEVHHDSRVQATQHRYSPAHHKVVVGDRAVHALSAIQDAMGHTIEFSKPRASPLNSTNVSNNSMGGSLSVQISAWDVLTSAWVGCSGGQFNNSYGIRVTVAVIGNNNGWYDENLSLGDGNSIASSSDPPTFTYLPFNYKTAGTYTIVAKAVETMGMNMTPSSGSASCTVVAVGPPSIEVSAAINGLDISTGNLLTCTGDVVSTGDLIWFKPDAWGGVKPYSYSWNYGDGSTDTGSSVSHEYSSAGSVVVKLDVSDKNSRQAGAVCSLTVSAANMNVVVSVTDATTGKSVSCSGGAVAVNDQLGFSASVTGGSGKFSLAWNMGDDSGSSDQATPGYAYSAPGTYGVSVTATYTSTGNTGQGTCSILVLNSTAFSVSLVMMDTTSGLSVSCGDSFAVNDTLVFDVTLDGGSGSFTYAWNFGDGGVSTASPPATHEYVLPGSYSVSVKVNDTKLGKDATAGGSDCTLTVTRDTLHSVSITISPASCGPAIVGWLPYGNTDVASLANGSYAISAPDCTQQGYNFSAWTGVGEVSVEDPGSPSTNINVRGDGALVLTYVKPPPSNPCGYTVAPFICIKAYITGYFVQGESVSNMIGVWAFSNGHDAQSVEGTVNGTSLVFAPPNSPDRPFEAVVDMGTLPIGEAKIQVTAAFADGSAQTGSYDKLTVIAIPSWWSTFDSSGTPSSNVEGQGEWENEWSFEISIEIELAKQWYIDFPEGTPLVGGGYMGLAPTITVKFSYESTGKISISTNLEVEQKLPELFGSEPKGSIAVQVAVNMNIVNGAIQWLPGTLSLTISAKVTVEFPTPYSVWVPVCGWLGLVIDVSPYVSESLSSALGPPPDPSVPTVFPFTLSGLTATLQAGFTIEAVDKLCTMSASVGADFKGSLSLSTDVPHVKGSITGEAYVTFKWIGLEEKLTLVNGTIWSSGPFRALDGHGTAPLRITLQNWTRIPRYYNVSGYNSIVWPSGSFQGTLLHDLYPETTLSGASSGATTYLLYTHDDVTQNQNNSFTIRGVSLNGSTRSAAVLPSPPEFPGKMILDPSVATMPNGTLLSLWRSLPNNGVNLKNPFNTTGFGLERSYYTPGVGWSGHGALAIGGSIFNSMVASCPAGPRGLAMISGPGGDPSMNRILTFDAGTGAILSNVSYPSGGVLSGFDCTQNLALLDLGVGRAALVNPTSGVPVALPILHGQHLLLATLVQGFPGHVAEVFSGGGGCTLAVYNMTRHVFLATTQIGCDANTMAAAKVGASDLVVLGNSTALAPYYVQPGTTQVLSSVPETGIESVGVAPQSGNQAMVWATTNYGTVNNSLLNLNASIIPGLMLAAPMVSPNPLEVGDTLNLSSSSPPPVAYFSWTGLPPGCVGGNQPNVICSPTMWGTYTPALSARSGSETATALSHTFTVLPAVSMAGIIPATDRPTANQNVSILAAPSGGIAPYSILWNQVPPGCTTKGPHAWCTIAKPGNYVVGASVTDKHNHSAQKAIVITVLPAAPAKAPTLFGLPVLWAYVLIILIAATIVAIAIHFVRKHRKGKGRQGPAASPGPIGGVTPGPPIGPPGPPPPPQPQ